MIAINYLDQNMVQVNIENSVFMLCSREFVDIGLNVGLIQKCSKDLNLTLLETTCKLYPEFKQMIGE